MKNKREFVKWRAEKLGYVYFSRLDELIISEPGVKDPLFDYLIDIGEENKQTGRLFGVELEALENKEPTNLKEKYKHIAMPALLVLFDNKTDKGYFKWIKKPGQNGHLSFENNANTTEELNNNSLHQIVNEIKSWYALQAVA
jgi:outer membrane protein assembly factor BamE (lipoprotein component of BamABCDE complex)